MFLLVGIMLILYPQAAAMGAREGIKMAFDVVISAILPFAVCASAVVYSGLARVIGALISPIFTKITGLNPYGGVALLSGMLGGYPTGSKVVCDMLSEGLITKKDAEKMLSYANVGGVVFSLNIIGKTAFGSYKTGVVIYLIHIASVLVSAAVLNKREKYSMSIQDEILFYRKQKKPFMTVLGKSIASGGTVMINIISSFIVFYAVIYALQIEKIPLLCGFVEMTKGVIYSGNLHSLPLAALFFSFGGVSVFAQTECVCEKMQLNLRYFYQGKIISALVAYVLMFIYVELCC